MSGYSLEDEDGKPYYTYHTDRVVCDDEGCACRLPSSAQERAQERAEGRNDWYVIVPGAKAMLGPVSAASARQAINDSLAAGLEPKLLRVAEDYQV